MVEIRDKRITEILLAGGYKPHYKGIYHGLVKYDGKDKRFHALFVNPVYQTKVCIHYDVKVRGYHQVAITRREEVELARLKRVKKRLLKT